MEFDYQDVAELVCYAAMFMMTGATIHGLGYAADAKACKHDAEDPHLLAEEAHAIHSFSLSFRAMANGCYVWALGWSLVAFIAGGLAA